MSVGQSLESWNQICSLGISPALDWPKDVNVNHLKANAGLYFPFLFFSSTLKVGQKWILSMSRNGSKVGKNFKMGFDQCSPTFAPQNPLLPVFGPISGQ